MLQTKTPTTIPVVGVFLLHLHKIYAYGHLGPSFLLYGFQGNLGIMRINLNFITFE